MVLLLVANLLRVAVLVAVGQVAGWRLVAEMLHVPLGVAGFVAACAASLYLLRWAGTWKDRPEEAALPLVQRPLWLAPVLSAALVGMALLYSPRAETTLAQGKAGWQFPPGLTVQSWPLSSGEQEWLAQAGVDTAERRHFTWRGLKGSLLLVSSTSWRAHHRPERCFEVYGLAVDQSRSAMIAADFPVRLLTLEPAGDLPGDPDLLSAAYWLQSAQQTTDDYATRIWADFAPQRQNWVLVTVLFDTPLDGDNADARDLYLALRDVVQQHLLAEVKP